MPQTMQQRRQQEYREMESHRIKGERMSELREEIELPLEHSQQDIERACGSLYKRYHGKDESDMRRDIAILERQLKSSLAANREQKATLADRDNHIDLAYKALGDVNRSVYLFDHIREQKAEIERLKERYRSLSLAVGKPMHSSRGAEHYADRLRVRADQAEAELVSLRASVGEKWIAYSESKPAYGETVEVLFSGPEIALCHREQEELADDDMREPVDILWDENGDQERSVMGIFWRKFSPPTLPGEEK